MASVTYRGASWTYEEVERGGLIWMDRNLGATQAATSSTDTNAYGHLFQWGRSDDGSQLRNSSTTPTQYTDDAAGNLFVSGSQNWRNPAKTELWNNGINIPIPTGWRLPTSAELEAERVSWASNDAAGAIGSTLKLPLAGYRYYPTGLVSYAGTYGIYWSSDINNTSRKTLLFYSTALLSTSFPATGATVRLVKVIPSTFIPKIIFID